MTHFLNPMLGDGALQFAIEKATPEGKATIAVLLALSMFSWTIIISKVRQLIIARRAAKKFFEAYSATRDPLDIQKRGEEFDGAPAFQVYSRAAEEVGLSSQEQSGHCDRGDGPEHWRRQHGSFGP